MSSSTPRYRLKGPSFPICTFPFKLRVLQSHSRPFTNATLPHPLHVSGERLSSTSASPSRQDEDADGQLSSWQGLFSSMPPPERRQPLLTAAASPLGGGGVVDGTLTALPPADRQATRTRQMVMQRRAALLQQQRCPHCWLPMQQSKAKTSRHHDASCECTIPSTFALHALSTPIHVVRYTHSTQYGNLKSSLFPLHAMLQRGRSSPLYLHQVASHEDALRAQLQAAQHRAVILHSFPIADSFLKPSYHRWTLADTKRHFQHLQPQLSSQAPFLFILLMAETRGEMVKLDRALPDYIPRCTPFTLPDEEWLRQQHQRRKRLTTLRPNDFSVQKHLFAETKAHLESQLMPSLNQKRERVLSPDEMPSQPKLLKPETLTTLVKDVIQQGCIQHRDDITILRRTLKEMTTEHRELMHAFYNYPPASAAASPSASSSPEGNEAVPGTQPIGLARMFLTLLRHLLPSEKDGIILDDMEKQVFHNKRQ